MKEIAETVELDAIEPALEQLWNRAAETEQQEKGHPLVRARALNLVVFSLAQDDAATLAGTADRVAESHPCRAILVVPASPSQPSPLQASVSAVCRAGLVSGEHVCGERITISANLEGLERVPSAVTPLLAPDLPVFLWWRGDLRLPNTAFSGLADVSDRLIIDTRDLGEPFLPLKLTEERGSEMAVSDLAWARLTPWRQLTAQFFDGPIFRPQLDSISKVSIAYASSTRIPPEALLFAGWLANRLQWRLLPDEAARTRNQDSVQFSGRKGEIEIEFRAVESARAGLASARLQTAAEPAAQFSILRAKDDPDSIETYADVPPAPPLTRAVRTKGDKLVALLAEELRIVGHDTLYEEALAAANLIGHQLRHG